MRTPVGHFAGEDDIGGDHDQRRRDQARAEFHIEDDADCGEFDQRRRDVEQQEIEHHVDALGAALDDLGEAPRPPFEMKAQRQRMDVAEHSRRQPPGRRLSDFLEDRVPQIVGQHATEPRAGIGDDQHGGGRPGGRVPAHRIDHCFVRKGHGQHDRLARQHQDQRRHHAQPKLGIVLRPQHRQEAPQDREAALLLI